MLWRTERELGAIGDNHKLTRFLAILPMKQLAQILTRCFLEAVKRAITGYKLVRGELQLCSQEGLRESASYYFNQVWEYGQVEWHGCSGGYFERMRERANAGWKLGVHCLCQLNPFTGELVGEAVEDSGHGDAQGGYFSWIRKKFDAIWAWEVQCLCRVMEFCTTNFIRQIKDVL